MSYGDAYIRFQVKKKKEIARIKMNVEEENGK